MTCVHEAAREFRNPVSGERIVIRESGARNGGRLLSFDLFLPPGGHVPAGHVHPGQEERFTVVAGRMRFRLGRRTVVAGPGETVVVPPGTAHWFGCDGQGPAHASVEVRPALRMEELFERTAASRGLPDLARVVLDFPREIAVPHVPGVVARAVLAPLALIGRRR